MARRWRAGAFSALRATFPRLALLPLRIFALSRWEWRVVGVRARSLPFGRRFRAPRPCLCAFLRCRIECGASLAGDFALPRTLYLNGGLSSPHTPSRSGLCPLQPPKVCFKPYGGGVHGASGAVRWWGVGAFFFYRSNLKHFYLVIMRVKFSTLLLR